MHVKQKKTSTANKKISTCEVAPPRKKRKRDGLVAPPRKKQVRANRSLVILKKAEKQAQAANKEAEKKVEAAKKWLESKRYIFDVAKRELDKWQAELEKA